MVMNDTSHSFSLNTNMNGYEQYFLRTDEIKQERTIISIHEHEQTIFTMHKWEQILLRYEHFQDLAWNDQEMTNIERKMP
jgi:hypothetical protein